SVLDLKPGQRLIPRNATLPDISRILQQKEVVERFALRRQEIILTAMLTAYATGREPVRPFETAVRLFKQFGVIGVRRGFRPLEALNPLIVNMLDNALKSGIDISSMEAELNQLVKSVIAYRRKSVDI